MIHLIGPGAAGKTSVGARLAKRLGIMCIDLDECFMTSHGDISTFIDMHGYAAYAAQNVQIYLDVVQTTSDPRVMALSSGFMTYPFDVHPQYPSLQAAIVSSATTLVLLPSLDYETCVAETVRRQLARSFCRSPQREEDVIRTRFGFYRTLAAAKLETMRGVSEVVEAAVLLLGMQQSAARVTELPRPKPPVR